MSEEERMPAEEGAAQARALCREAAGRHEQADYRAARSLYKQALAIQEQTPGPLHPDTARTLHGLAEVQMKLGRDDDARSRLERALAIQEEVLGPEHPDTAASLHTLAELHSNLGDPETGLQLMARALTARQVALGSQHPDTLESMTLLALMLAQQGERAKAQEMLFQALALCERALGEDHRTTARVLNGLGRLYAAEETTYVQAQQLYERALAIYERLLGPDHPQTALVLNNLASLLADRQDDDAARQLLERSLAVHEQVYGADDWRTSFVLVNLADLHNRQGQHVAARSLLERALIIRERAWSARHPETVRCLRELVATLGHLHQQGDEDVTLASMALYPCLVSLERAGQEPDPKGASMPGTYLDPDQAARQLHRLVEQLDAERTRPPLSAAQQAELESARELARQAGECYQRGDYAAAAAHLEGALDLQQRVLGEHHLDHVALLKRLADAREREGRYSTVLPILQQVTDIHIQVLGADHPATALALSELMQRQAYEYGSAASRPLQEQILQSMTDTLGPDDPIVKTARQAYDIWSTQEEEGLDGQVPTGPSLSERREEALATLSATEGGPLAGLEAIDWHSLQHAYGPAGDVPHLLRLLLSEDEAVRDSAWQELYGNIWHQGDVYQATGYAVPFLIRMLDSPEGRDPYSILSFLQAIATGQSALTGEHTWMEPVLAEQGRDFQAEVERAGFYARQASQAVGDGLDIYLAYLGHPDPEVRQATATLACAFPEQAERVLPALRARIETEDLDQAKAHLVQSLGRYLPESLPTDERSAHVEFLAELVRSEENQVRFAAAVALTRLAGDGTPPQAIAVLEQALADADGLYPGPGDDVSAFYAGEIVEEVCAALSQLRADARIPILARLLERTTEPAGAHRLAVLLLDSALLGTARTVSYTGFAEASPDAVFYATVHPVAADDVEERIYPEADGEIEAGLLTPDQRQALQAVLDSPAVWRIRSNLLQLYGLSGFTTGARTGEDASKG